MIKQVIDTYDNLSDFNKDELIQMVIALDTCVEEAKVTIKTITELNCKLLKELGLEEEKREITEKYESLSTLH